MELNNYGTLVEKLAEEIIGNALMEKEAEENIDAELEKEAGVASNIEEVGRKASEAGKSAARVVKEEIAGAPEKAQTAIERAKAFAKAHKTGLAAGAAGAGAGYVAGRVDGAHKQAEEEEYELEKTAAEQAIAVLEKASQVYEDAEFMKQAAYEVLAEAEMYQDAAARIFEDMGITDEE